MPVPCPPGDPATLWLSADRWFNTPRPIGPADLRGRAVLLYAFQMLCPMCVDEGTPLVTRIHRRVRGRDDVAVIGLHTVFENHRAQSPDALISYLARAGVRFPVGVDRHERGDDVPVTMKHLLLMGTPTMVSVDRQGRVRERLFGVPTEDALMTRLERMAEEARAD